MCNLHDVTWSVIPPYFHSYLVKMGLTFFRGTREQTPEHRSIGSSPTMDAEKSQPKISSLWHSLCKRLGYEPEEITQDDIDCRYRTYVVGQVHCLGFSTLMTTSGFCVARYKPSNGRHFYIQHFQKVGWRARRRWRPQPLSASSILSRVTFLRLCFAHRPHFYPAPPCRSFDYVDLPHIEWLRFTVITRERRVKLRERNRNMLGMLRPFLLSPTLCI